MWAAEAPPYTLEDGVFGGRIHDLQGRFNLNSLKPVADKAERPGQLSVQEARFMRLLQSFEDIEVTDIILTGELLRHSLESVFI